MHIFTSIYIIPTYILILNIIYLVEVISTNWPDPDMSAAGRVTAGRLQLLQDFCGSVTFASCARPGNSQQKLSAANDVSCIRRFSESIRSHYMVIVSINFRRVLNLFKLKTLSVLYPSGIKLNDEPSVLSALVAWTGTVSLRFPARRLPEIQSWCSSMDSMQKKGLAM